MKTAVVYARYSSDNQTEQSIEGQLHVCQRYAENNDILIVDTYIDRAMTGTNDMRPDFQRMIKDSAKKQWDYVLVYKLDRFSRNKYEATIHKHTLRENGVKLISAMENIPDSPEGIILESLLEGMNQYYSEELSQKVHRGLRESYSKGLFTGGPIVFGYDVVDKKVVINPAEAEIIREIFTKYSEGFTAKSIAKDLTDRGIRNKLGEYFQEKMIFKIIKNTKYNGKIKHEDTVYENIYPMIIDDELWGKVKDIRTKNQHSPGRKKEIFNFLLSGKLVCGKCNHLMVGESGTSKSGSKYYYYSCLAKRRKQHPCGLKAVDKQWLEDIVINTTWALFTDKHAVRDIAETLNQIHIKESKDNTNLKSLLARKQSAMKASQNLISAIEQGVLTEQTKTRLKELETEIIAIDFDISREQQRNFTYLSAEKIESFLNRAIKGEIEDLTIRKLLINIFIREIVLDSESITITYNFCDNNTKYEISTESITGVKKQSKKKTAYNKKWCSNKCDSIQPICAFLSVKSA